MLTTTHGVDPAADRRALSAVAYGFIALEGPLRGPGDRSVHRLAERRRGHGRGAGRAHGRRAAPDAHAAARVGRPRPGRRRGRWVRQRTRLASATWCGAAAPELGEYFRLQVGRQIYPALVHLDAGLVRHGRRIRHARRPAGRSGRGPHLHHRTARGLARRRPVAGRAARPPGGALAAGRRRRQRRVLHRAVRGQPRPARHRARPARRVAGRRRALLRRRASPTGSRCFPATRPPPTGRRGRTWC